MNRFIKFLKNSISMSSGLFNIELDLWSNRYLLDKSKEEIDDEIKQVRLSMKESILKSLQDNYENRKSVISRFVVTAYGVNKIGNVVISAIKITLWNKKIQFVVIY